MCEHEVHDTESRYDREAGLLRHFLVCHDCREPIKLVSTTPYMPEPLGLDSEPLEDEGSLRDVGKRLRSAA